MKKEIILDHRVGCAAIRLKDKIKDEPNGLHQDYDSVLFFISWDNDIDYESRNIFKILKDKIKVFENLGFICQEPKKTLFYNRDYLTGNEPYYHQKDVKEALKELLNIFEGGHYTANFIHKTIKEIFGKELLE